MCKKIVENTGKNHSLRGYLKTVPFNSIVMNKKMKNLIPTALAFIFLSTLSWQSYACSCIKRSTQEWYSMASSVFYAQIIKAELKEKHTTIINNITAHDSKYVLGKYKVLETFKGKNQSYGNVIDEEFRGGNCSVGLTVSDYYIFFIYADNKINICNGSHKLRANDIEELRTLKRNSK